MPSDPAPITVMVRPPDQAPYILSLERLTDHIRVARLLRMTTTRDELKKKRLQAMAVVSTEIQATSDMYDRIVTAGTVVAKARSLAETAHMDALNEHLAILREDAEELAEFAQAAPTPAGAPPAPTSLAPVKTALDDLLSAAPNPSKEAWEKGDAYVGTRSA